MSRSLLLKTTSLLVFSMFATLLPVSSQSPANKPSDATPVIPTPPDGTETARKQLGAFRVPAGMKVELFAAEPTLLNPVAFSRDDKGRIYVAEEFRFSRGTEENRTRDFFLNDDLQIKTLDDRLKMYEKHAKQFPGGMNWFTRCPDRIRLLEDTNGDGVADKSTVFAEFNESLDGLAAGVLPWKNDVFVTNIPHLWRLRDTKGKGVADVRDKLLTGFGVNCAFLGHDLHGLIVGPDGKLYFSIGDRGYHVTSKEGKTYSGPRTGAVFRCNFDGSELEVVHRGLRNPQELAFDQYGNLFADDNNCDKGDHARLVYIVEGGDSGWNMAYQTIPAPYMAGPWFAERLWHLQHADQPAYIVPPVGKIGTGPGGFCFISGSSLPDRYKNTFLMANYTGNGGIEAFKVKPVGAGFEIDDYHDFMKPFHATDVELGSDGQIYVSDFGPLKWDGTHATGRIFRLFDPAGLERSEVKEMKKIFEQGFDKLKTEELVHLLSHAEMKVRLRAQFELVERKANKELVDVAQSGKNQLARIHAIWGVGQLSKEITLPHLRLLNDIVKKAGEDSEVQAQIIKTLGVKQLLFRDTISSAIKHSSPRVRYFAAEALGHNTNFGGRLANTELSQLIEENGVKDPFLRHAAAHALSKLVRREDVAKVIPGQSPAVRMAIVLVMRKQNNSDVVQYLNDPDLLVQTEAARAIHDLNMLDQYPPLAELLTRLPANPTSEHDPLIRRAISAAYRLGKADLAKLVVNVAVNEKMPMSLRYEAIQALKDWGNPPPRDRVTGFWNPILERTGRDIKAVVESNREPLLGMKSAKLQTEALRLMIAVGANVDDKLLAVWLHDTGKDPALRVASLQFLAERKSPLLKELLESSLKDRTAVVKATAMEILARTDSSKAFTALQAALESQDEPVLVRQRAYALLPVIKTSESNKLLDQIAAKLDTIPTEYRLDAVEALKAAPSPTRDKLRSEYEGNPRDMMVYGKKFSLVGGDSEKGKELFFNHTSTQCVRCHKIAGQGGVAGPDLTDVMKRNPEKTREHLLESLILPNAKIAPGFGVITITLDDGRLVAGVLQEETKEMVTVQTAEGKKVNIATKEIEKRTNPTSAMPSVDRTLSPREVRDLIEFLMQAHSSGKDK